MTQLYKKPYLTNVICKIDFPIIFSLRQGTPEKYQEAIYKRFPLSQENKKIDIHYDVNLERGRNDFITNWIFTNKEKNKVVVITPDSLILEYKSYYTDFKEFEVDIKFLIEHLFEIYPIEIITRIGLRYINQIILNTEEGNPFEWEKFIHKSLISHVDFIDDKKHIARSMHLIETKYDDYSMRFQYGLFNSEYPSTISRKEFALDYDCSIKDEVEKEEVIPTIVKFNDVVTNYFEDSIQDGLREIMNK